MPRTKYPDYGEQYIAIDNSPISITKSKLLKDNSIAKEIFLRAYRLHNSRPGYYLYTSNKKLSSIYGCSERTIERAFRLLLKYKLIKVVSNYSTNCKGKYRKFKLDWKWTDALIYWTKKKGFFNPFLIESEFTDTCVGSLYYNSKYKINNNKYEPTHVSVNKSPKKESSKSIIQDKFEFFKKQLPDHLLKKSKFQKDIFKYLKIWIFIWQDIEDEPLTEARIKIHAKKLSEHTSQESAIKSLQTSIHGRSISTGKQYRSIYPPSSKCSLPYLPDYKKPPNKSSYSTRSRLLFKFCGIDAPKNLEQENRIMKLKDFIRDKHSSLKRCCLIDRFKRLEHFIEAYIEYIKKQTWIKNHSVGTMINEKIWSGFVQYLRDNLWVEDWAEKDETSPYNMGNLSLEDYFKWEEDQKRYCCNW